MQTIISNCRVLETDTGRVGPESHVLFEDSRIREVFDGPIRTQTARVVDARGRILMPGLIDLHVHLTAIDLDLAASQRASSTLVAFDAISEMRRTLARGFTTVRDAGGADRALAQLVESGSVVGPRIFVAGRALSQTGGHGDFGDASGGHLDCARCAIHRPLGALARVADGVDGIRVAVREELRAGADQIKLMVSGGVASPSDPLLGTQFSRDEIRAAVAEATAWGSYVMAHAYSAPAIRRAAEEGVRTVEHVNLIDRDTAGLLADLGVYAVPTLIAYEAALKAGREFGAGAVQLEKLNTVLEAGLESLAILADAGVKTGFGSDLLGPVRDMQSMEFELRREVLPAADVIASATVTAAEVLGQAGNLGVVAPDATADLLVVDGDPTDDIAFLGSNGRHLSAIIKDGKFVKNTLD